MPHIVLVPKAAAVPNGALCAAGGKPPTRLPPGKLVEQLAIEKNIKSSEHATTTLLRSGVCSALSEDTDTALGQNFIHVY